MGTAVHGRYVETLRSSAAATSAVAAAVPHVHDRTDAAQLFEAALRTYANRGYDATKRKGELGQKLKSRRQCKYWPYVPHPQHQYAVTTIGVSAALLPRVGTITQCRSLFLRTSSDT